MEDGYIKDVCQKFPVFLAAYYNTKTKQGLSKFILIEWSTNFSNQIWWKTHMEWKT